jgi:hypothetical protein
MAEIASASLCFRMDFDYESQELIVTYIAPHTGWTPGAEVILFRITGPTGVFSLNAGYIAGVFTAPDIINSVQNYIGGINLPLDLDNNVANGLYKLEAKAKETSGSTDIYTFSQEYELDYSRSTIVVTAAQDLRTSVLTFTDNTDYTNDGDLVSPTVTRSHVITPPDSSGLSPVTKTGASTSYGPNIWTQTWVDSMTATLSYDLDTYLSNVWIRMLDEFSGECAINVQNADMSALYSAAFKTINDRLLYYRGKRGFAETDKLQKDRDDLNFYWGAYQMLERIGGDTSYCITGINAIINYNGITIPSTLLSTEVIPWSGIGGITIVQGSVWYDGAGVPSVSLGTNGDYYLRTNGYVYEKIAGAWVYIMSLLGASGAQGTTGIQGTIGTTGIQGVQGIQGIQGVQGTTGGTGIIGESSYILDFDTPALLIPCNSSGVAIGTYLPATSILRLYYGTTEIDISTLIPSMSPYLCKVSYASEGTGLGLQISIDDITSGVTPLTGGVIVGVTYGGQTRYKQLTYTKIIASVDGASIQGTTGTQGLQGLTGVGVQGLTGIQGSLGIQGSTGTTGSAGVGVQGIQGAGGTAGDKFATTSGQTKTIASSGSFTLTDVTSGLAYSVGQEIIVAHDGSNYMIGTVTSYSGTTLVFTATSAVGSGTESSWAINMNGAPGPAGTVGTQGATGTQGTAGTSVQGATGAQGTIGTAIQGTTGTTGAQGVTGTTVQGITGAQGVQGIDGPRGVAAAEAATGTSTPIGSVYPVFVGQLYLNTVNNAVYSAFGMTRADWKLVSIGTTSVATSSGDPSGSLTPIYFGQLCLRGTTGNYVKLYIAAGLTNTDWEEVASFT